MRATVTELTSRLKEKESMINEIVEQRTKLENYTKKTLHAVQTKYMVAVSSHRNQLSEKDERLDFLEKKLKEIRASYSREQALMMSSFYEVRHSV
jgi:chromosome segregation ATPase